MATVSLEYGSYSAITVTALQSMASSATVGWQSDRISNLSTQALDYEILIVLPMANTAPANDRAVYFFVSPAVTTDGGTTWYHADGGTTTAPSGTQGAYTIAGVTTTNNLDLLRALAYTTQNQTIQATLRLSDLYDVMPEGFSFVVVDYSGAALSTGCIISVRPVKEQVV